MGGGPCPPPISWYFIYPQIPKRCENRFITKIAPYLHICSNARLDTQRLVIFGFLYKKTYTYVPHPSLRVDCSQLDVPRFESK